MSARLLLRAALPFGDAGSAQLPLGRILRLSLFQVTVGMALVLLSGTLNRVMVIEIGLPVSFVSFLIGLPLVVAPFRAIIGFKSDNHRSLIGWRRVPYVWIGTMLQFGGFALMPFGMLLLGEHRQVVAGHAGLALAFILVGAGMHTVQTAGLALATDLAPPAERPRVVALLYTMLLIGMIGSALLFGWLLRDFEATKLVRCIQSAAVATVLLNFIGLWNQERRTAKRPDAPEPDLSLGEAWRELDPARRPRRLLVALALGTAAFGVQDTLLEPYGGQVFGMSVSDTTLLTALLAAGMLVGFALAARLLSRGADPHLIAALGLLSGVPSVAAVIFAGPLHGFVLFEAGTAGIGFAGGLFAVGTLAAAMALGGTARNGLALGLWGAVQATAGGLAIAAGGGLRDLVESPVVAAMFGPGLADSSAGYGAVYHAELALLFAALVAIGPLVRMPGAEAAAARLAAARAARAAALATTPN